MNSHLTAIHRKALPVPVQWLAHAGLLYGNVLDYGCGKCRDVNDTFLTKVPDVKSVLSYDPHYEPLAFCLTSRRKWDVILCTYVLCTLPKNQVAVILANIQSRLAKNGVAYITVRNDKPKSGYGRSSRGTFQRKVTLKLRLLKQSSQYRIYLLTPGTSLV